MNVKIIEIRNEKFTYNEKEYDGQRLFFFNHFKNETKVESCFVNNHDYIEGETVEVRYSKNYNKFRVVPANTND